MRRVRHHFHHSVLFETHCNTKFLLLAVIEVFKHYTALSHNLSLSGIIGKGKVVPVLN
jgi:hypothetical protein